MDNTLYTQLNNYYAKLFTYGNISNLKTNLLLILLFLDDFKNSDLQYYVLDTDKPIIEAASELITLDFIR